MGHCLVETVHSVSILGLKVHSESFEISSERVLPGQCFYIVQCVKLTVHHPWRFDGGDGRFSNVSKSPPPLEFETEVRVKNPVSAILRMHWSF